MADFGEYAPYIWSAFVLTAVAFAWMIGDSLLRARHWRRKAEGGRAAKDA